MANVYHGPNAESRNLRERLEKAEQLNAELARMLTGIQWTSEAISYAQRCPVCTAMRIQEHHLPDCALAALLKKATTE